MPTINQEKIGSPIFRWIVLSLSGFPTNWAICTGNAITATTGKHCTTTAISGLFFSWNHFLKWLGKQALNEWGGTWIVLRIHVTYLWPLRWCRRHFLSDYWCRSILLYSQRSDSHFNRTGWCCFVVVLDPPRHSAVENKLPSFWMFKSFSAVARTTLTEVSCWPHHPVTITATGSYCSLRHHSYLDSEWMTAFKANSVQTCRRFTTKCRAARHLYDSTSL